jgi:hypothetical protein
MTSEQLFSIALLGMAGVVFAFLAIGTVPQ